MNKTFTFAAVIVAATLAGAAACSNTSSNDATVPFDAGPPGIDASFASCPAACATAKTCDSRVDIAACEAQCHKEISGQGYLDMEVVVPYFDYLAAQTNDPWCDAVKQGPWKGSDPGTFEVTVAHPELLEACASARATCAGLSVDMARMGCFFSYYWFNPEIRAKLELCFKTCAEQKQCLCDSRDQGRPWLTMPPDPNLPSCSD